jgi:pSer/pThr/pTyr-binding forkhead associated (FHA) protein
MNKRDDDTGVINRQTLKSGSIGEHTVPETLQAELKVIAGKDAGKKFPITKAETIYGRGSDADVKIDDDKMSRRHATIIFRNVEFRIKDLESSNGTLLNGSEVTEYAVRNGDKIMMGETMFQFTVKRV